MTDKLRGRPTGTEINDDAALAKIADMLVASPKMKLAAVFRAVRSAGRYKGQSDRAIDERWRSKWKRRSQTEISAANKRTAKAAQPTVSSGGGGYVGGFDLGISRAAMGLGPVFDPIMEAQRSMDRMIEPMRAAQKMADQVKMAAMGYDRYALGDTTYGLMRKMEEQQRAMAAQLTTDKVRAAAIGAAGGLMHDMMRKMEEQKRMMDQITMMDRYTRWPYR
jgi:hypothetical protein